MPEVVAPPVRVLDFGWQAPNPTDWLRAGSNAVAPITQAVENVNAQKNQFLMGQLQRDQAMRQSAAEMGNARYLQQANMEKQFQLAEWQHTAQIKRESMRDQRMIEIQQMRDEARANELKSKYGLNSLEKSVTFLRNQIGGTVPARETGETDEAYKSKVDAAAAQQLVSNTHADAKLKVALKARQDQLNEYLTGNASSFQQANAAAAANTQKEALQKTMTEFVGAHPEVATAMQQGKSFPEALAVTKTASDFKESYDGYHQAFQSQWLHQNGHLFGGAAANLAAVKAELQIIAQKQKSIDLMPGENGRTVQKPWASQSDNMANDLMLQDLQQKRDAQQKPVVAPAAPVHAPGAAIFPPGMTLPSSNPTAPVPMGDDMTLNPDGSVAQRGTPVTNPFMIGQLGPKIDAARTVAYGDNLLSFMRGQGAPPVSPAGNSIMFPPVAGGVPSTSVSGPGIMPPVATTNSVPVAAPTMNMMMPPVPAASPFPAGASVNPMAGLMPPNFQSDAVDTSGWDNILNLQRMRALYSQP